MEVLSPPGIIRPSSPSRCSGRRTGTASAFTLCRMFMCSIKAPCIARTPIFILPTSWCQELLLRNLLDIQPGHGFTQILRDLGNDGRVLVVGSCLDDGSGSGFGVAGLEYARADEDTVCPQLHHQRGV